MKNFSILLFALLITTVAFAQKKEKIKGSKNVTVAQKELEPFESLEIEDNIELYLVKGTTQSLEIEADDNLHEIIKSDVNGTALRIYTSKDVSSSKKLTVRLTYTGSLKTITAKNEVQLYAINELELDTVSVKNFDSSKSFLNVKSAKFSLAMNDKTKAEINVKSGATTIELSKNANLKALIASPEVKIDMYQKTIAIVEGDAVAAAIRVDNNAEFTGKKFTVKNLDLTAESYTKCAVLATETLSLSASGKTEVSLYGSPTSFSVKKFSNSAVIFKKED
ncbi:hypothetical protein Q765_18010 [Flavobacterium rivuli WB 3.3-2 = DSM 21788]|uniref:Putative auto-transporter adhesin head GIN domain-containing protein n=1 Tax=Flavobacterium rivuli WB 3.3-2 = DSM 21788 TaxID=1121895 RepID=A0A0A2M125_9FLAO|nr:DUF2807 domain-containing protein [Flavobacterium rivuli]KGO85143.1 hypothetical protein Q765_18010 [Flavobacterium rivuli WB 3.3-2 = DSM 21788]